MTEETGFLEPEDVSAIGRIVRRELAKASDPEARMKASYDFDDDTDIRPAREQRAHRTFVREQLAQQGLEAGEGVTDEEAADAWQARHDEDARSRCLPDETPKTPKRRSGDEPGETLEEMYDYG